jgi:RNase P/RNase MRP subunit p29
MTEENIGLENNSELSRDLKLIKLRLKTLIRTDEAYLVDLGQGKVWIPKSAIKSTRRIDQGILEVEVLENVIKEKRQEMRKLKEQLTGLKGSIMGEVIELSGELVEETRDTLLIKIGPQELYLPKVCFSEWDQLAEAEYRFVIQKDFLEFKLRQLQQPDRRDAITTVAVKMIQETDRAYLLGYEGHEIWFPKRAVIEAKDKGKEWEIVVATDFWMFKLEKQVS